MAASRDTRGPAHLATQSDNRLRFPPRFRRRGLSSDVWPRSALASRRGVRLACGRAWDAPEPRLPALAHVGNDLIVDQSIEFPTWRLDLAEVLAGLDVYLIGVHRDLDEIDRRDRERSDRRIGEGRTHVALGPCCDQP
jgi:hypothetical protein